MNAVGVLDRGFVTAAELLMEKKLFALLSLLTVSVSLGITIVVACHYRCGCKCVHLYLKGMNDIIL